MSEWRTNQDAYEMICPFLHGRCVAAACMLWVTRPPAPGELFSMLPPPDIGACALNLPADRATS